MKDIRSQLPECPLAYEVPFIPTHHTALLIPITAADVEWQERMLPWTLASLINNTDLIMNGVHLYIVCDKGTEARIQTALSLFDLPENTIFEETSVAVNSRYDAILQFDTNFWAFRDESNTHKLNFSGLDIIKPYPPISEISPAPMLYDMTHCTSAQFRHAIKHLLGAQLGITV
ncbi:MAG: hypothetical protein OXU51_07770 [Candidatus Poribacteria bacterium]|nr:hypothetical protein [Candidatus Poribacteria bacterium]